MVQSRKQTFPTSEIGAERTQLQAAALPYRQTANSPAVMGGADPAEPLRKADEVKGFHDVRIVAVIQQQMTTLIAAPELQYAPAMRIRLLRLWSSG